jgi:hypothetical protein
MKITPIRFPALALMLGASMSFAQTPTPPQQNPQASPPSAHTPPKPQQPPNPANPADRVNPPDPTNPVNKGMPPGSAMPQSKPFQMLDIGKAGKLTKQQAGADPWLTQNFVTCDANSNNEVTENEYATCTRGR